MGTIFFSVAQQHKSVLGHHVMRLLGSHTVRHTADRIPLNEWSFRRTGHCSHNAQQIYTTNCQALGVFRTHDPNNEATADINLDRMAAGIVWAMGLLDLTYRISRWLYRTDSSVTFTFLRKWSPNTTGRTSIPTFVKDFYLSKELFGRLVYGGDGILNLHLFTNKEN